MNDHCVIKTIKYLLLKSLQYLYFFRGKTKVMPFFTLFVQCQYNQFFTEKLPYRCDRDNNLSFFILLKLWSTCRVAKFFFFETWKSSHIRLEFRKSTRNLFRFFFKQRFDFFFFVCELWMWIWTEKSTFSHFRIGSNIFKKINAVR